MLKTLTFPSPDNKKNAILTPLGKTESGSIYYKLSIDENPLAFKDRIFGEVCLWSPESRFITVQEWKDTDESIQPKSCQLLIVDLVARRECVVASVDRRKCNILPEGFIGESLMYSVIYDGQYGTTRSFESKFQYLDDWQTIK
ncbi:MAG TPA: hypothetical protein VJ972_07595 [Anaerolineales bacterium]|nr:hypothetical protein [Anaerolineales bacterium]